MLKIGFCRLQIMSLSHRDRIADPVANRLDGMNLREIGFAACPQIVKQLRPVAAELVIPTRRHSTTHIPGGMLTGMSLTATIATSLSFAFGKFLLKKYLNDDGVDSAYGVLADIGQSKIKNVIDRRAVARAAESWADQVVSDLTSVLDDEQKQHPELDVDAIGRELLETLSGDLAPEFFLAGDLDPHRVAAEYRERRPLPKGQLNLASDLIYEKCLDHAVQSLLNVVSTLPRFQERAIAETLKRLRNVDDVVVKILELGRRIERQVKRVSTEGVSEKFEVEYRKAVASNLDYIELFGITIPHELRRFQLTDAFVSLNLQRSTVATGESKRSKGKPQELVEDKELNSESLDYKSALDRLQLNDGRLLIRGAAGSGKTTLLRKIAIEAAGLGSKFLRHEMTSGVLLLAEVDQISKFSKRALERFNSGIPDETVKFRDQNCPANDC